MTEYINKTKLINEGWELRRIYRQDKHTMVCEAKKIADIPSADVVERKKGKWKTAPVPGIEEEANICPFCRWLVYAIEPLNFCPNCGAEMSCPQTDGN